MGGFRLKTRVQSCNFVENIVRYQTVKYRYRFARHIHQFAELVIPLNGSLTITVNDVPEQFGVGQAAFVLPFQPHSYNSEEYNELAIFTFSQSFIPEIYNTIDGMIQKSSVFTPDRSTLLMFDEKVFEKPEIDLMAIKSVIYGMLSTFVKNVELSPVPKYHTVSDSIVKYISEHITEKITLKELAAALGYTPNYISSIINRVFGEGLTSVIATIKFEKAINLLCNTDKSCYNICYECGFGSERTFFRKFKEVFGTTPTDYRTHAKLNQYNKDKIKSF